MGYDLQRYSPLTQINKDNVKQLVPVWNYSFDDNRSEESQPLVYKGVIYVTTNSATMAIDAKTGKQIWKTKVEYPPETPRIACCGIINRGVALYDGKVFRTTLDANVIALDAKTGKELWRAERDRLQERIFDDGRAARRRRRGDHRHLRRRVRHPRLHRRLGCADRQASVAHLHRPGPGEPGGDTWPGDTWQHGGGSTWLTGSYDPELHTVYWGTGNPGSVQRRRPHGRQSLHLLGAGARSQDRQDQVALPVLAERPVRLRRRRRDGAGDDQDRRQADQGR